MTEKGETMESDYLPVPMPDCERGRALAALGLTVEAAFIPWSKSRNAGEKNPSLNWRVRVMHNGREVLSTDYMAGSGHCPAYKSAIGSPRTIYNAERIWRECESGRAAGSSEWNKGAPILPNALDVIHSLTSDGAAIDCATFEEWAAGYGYDPDSRKAEGIYRVCLEIGLKLRAALGDAGLATLRATFEDY